MTVDIGNPSPQGARVRYAHVVDAPVNPGVSRGFIDIGNPAPLPRDLKRSKPMKPKRRRPQPMSPDDWAAEFALTQDLEVIAVRTAHKLTSVRAAYYKHGPGYHAKYAFTKRAMDPGILKWIQERLDAGDRLSDIARKLGKAPSTIFYVVHKFGLKRPALLPGEAEDIKAVHVLYGSLKSLRKVAQASGLSSGRVYHILRSYRPDGRRLRSRRTRHGKLDTTVVGPGQVP
jgi:hypothetical protein